MLAALPKAPTSPVVWTDRERVWNVLRMQTQPWTHAHIVCVSEVELAFVRSFVGRLARAGYVLRTNPDQHSEGQFLLVKNTGPKPPVIQRDGTLRDMNKPCIVQSASQRIWRALRRHYKQWSSVKDLVTEANVSAGTLSTYLRALARAGYVEQEPPGAHFRSVTAWRLVKRGGQLAPRTKRDGSVVDPNRKGAAR